MDELGFIMEFIRRNMPLLGLCGEVSVRRAMSERSLER
jgi:hypothetical protein